MTLALFLVLAFGFAAIGYMMFRRTPSQLAANGRKDEARALARAERVNDEPPIGGPDAEDAGPHGTSLR